jgi:hypothetical protein
MGSYVGVFAPNAFPLGQLVGFDGSANLNATAGNIFNPEYVENPGPLLAVANCVGATVLPSVTITFTFAELAPPSGPALTYS